MKSIAMALSLMAAAATPAVTGAAAAQAPAAAPLAPSGKWVVDYDDAACILSRDFGTGPALTTIGFKPSPFGDNIEVVMITAGAGAPYRKGEAKLILEPSGRVVPSTVEIFRIKARDRMVATLTAQGDVAADLQTSSTVAIELGDGSRRSVAVTNITKAFGALQKCQVDLVKGWGIDPAEFDRIKTPPTDASPALWISGIDYPGDALKNEAHGVSTIVWSVNTDGRVADCKVVKSSGTASLDQAACRAVALRGRYKPALGMDGKPVVAHQMRNVVWHLPQ